MERKEVSGEGFSRDKRHSACYGSWHFRQYEYRRRLDFKCISFNVTNDKFNDWRLNSFIQKCSSSKYPLIFNMNIQYLI